MEVWEVIKWLCLIFIVGGFILPFVVIMNVRSFLATKYNARIDYIKKLKEEKME